MIEIDRSIGIPAYRQIYQAIREDIENGTLSSGAKLPALRTLAKDLGVARNTIEAAYGQLVLEGYLKSRRGSGYVVEELDFTAIENPSPAHSDSGSARGQTANTSIASYAHSETEHDRNSGCTFDFSYGDHCVGSFPADQWKQCADQALTGQPAGLDSYTDAFGLWELRVALSRRLKETRGVRCTPEQILVMPGTQSILNELISLFDHDERRVCMENPGYYAARHVFESRSCTIIPIPAHKGATEFTRSLKHKHANLLWLTPSNQFPLGSTMPLKARLEAIDWAKREDAYIIEDDYCCEFRYGSKPIPSLHSLDMSDHVIYLGTMSKILSPALRISYAVLPQAILERWEQHSAIATSSVPWLTQKSLQLFMTKGKWNTYVRNTVNQYRTKQRLLLGCLETDLGGNIDILGADAGQHLVVNVRDGRSSKELIEAAMDNDVRVYSLDHCWATTRHPLGSCVLLGYSSIEDELIPEGISRLRDAWFT